MTKPPSTTTAKLGPGEYVPDVAFTKTADLPRPKIIKQQRNYAHLPCPHCGTPAARDKVFLRTLRNLGDLVSGRPHELHITYSQHYCRTCAKYFNADLTDLAPRGAQYTPRGAQYTHRVMRVAIWVVTEDGVPYRPASWLLWRDHRVFVPFATIQNWVEQAGKKAAATWETEYLDWALADFSGYLAADELYDGPFCILSIVDNQTFKRLFYQVLDHAPDQADLISLTNRFNISPESMPNCEKNRVK